MPFWQWKGVTFLVWAEPAKGGGQSAKSCSEGEEREDKLGILLMTKLLSPRHQVNLSQR